MNDLSVLEEVLEWSASRQGVFVNELKLIWQARELEYISKTGRAAFCDCLMFQPGDYIEARRRAETKL